MNRLAKLALLVLVAAAGSMPLSVRAGFEEDDIRSLAHQVKQVADKAMADIAAERASLPAADRNAFLHGLEEISRQATELASRSPAKSDDAGHGSRAERARTMHAQVRQLTQRAEALDHQHLQGLLGVAARLAGQLADELE